LIKKWEQGGNGTWWVSVNKMMVGVYLCVFCQGKKKKEWKIRPAQKERPRPD
jgi:hypothetical protein